MSSQIVFPVCFFCLVDREVSTFVPVSVWQNKPTDCCLETSSVDVTVRSCVFDNILRLKEYTGLAIKQNSILVVNISKIIEGVKSGCSGALRPDKLELQ